MTADQNFTLRLHNAGHVSGHGERSAKRERAAILVFSTV